MDVGICRDRIQRGSRLRRFPRVDEGDCLVRIIFDLDDTLADTSHRNHFLQQDPKDWQGFYEACGGDALLEPVATTFAAFATRGDTLEIWSGRSETVFSKTRKWLNDNHLANHFMSGVKLNDRGKGRYALPIFMRPAGDVREDIDLKHAWLKQLREEGGDVDLVLEDRTRMVKFWRSQGITCFQVADGDF